MKGFSRALVLFLVAIVLCIAVFKCSKEKLYKKEFNEYATKYEASYGREDELKEDLDGANLKIIRLQKSLDSCEFNLKDEIDVYTSPKVLVSNTPKKSKSAKKFEDLFNQARLQRDSLLEAKAKMEVEKDLAINKLNRQMDTCAYYVREMDKAMGIMSNDITNLTNKKDSLQNVLDSPITQLEEFPCIKTRRGVQTTATVVPSHGKMIISTVKLDKKGYKALKKQCKK